MKIGYLAGTEEVVFPAVKKVIAASHVGKHAMPDFIGNKTNIPNSGLVGVQAGLCIVNRGTDKVSGGHIASPVEKPREYQ
jgi:hypothetical protein